MILICLDASLIPLNDTVSNNTIHFKQIDFLQLIGIYVWNLSGFEISAKATFRQRDIIKKGHYNWCLTRHNDCIML